MVPVLTYLTPFVYADISRLRGEIPLIVLKLEKRQMKLVSFPIQTHHHLVLLKALEEVIFVFPPMLLAAFVLVLSQTLAMLTQLPIFLLPSGTEKTVDFGLFFKEEYCDKSSTEVVTDDVDTGSNTHEEKPDEEGWIGGMFDFSEEGELLSPKQR